MKKVAVGSTNPTKIQATKIAFEKIFPEETWEIIGTSVPSGIPDQPKSTEQTIQGAQNRAQRALETLQADFGVGLEGGMQKIGERWLETGWIVIKDKNGNEGIGSSIHMLVPPKLISHIEQGKELGVATDIEFITIESGKKQGFFGLMTNNAIDRTNAYADGVISALSRFLHPHLFEM